MYTHTQQSVGDNEHQSQSLSLQVQETALWARELSASFKEGPPEPSGQQGREVLSPARQSLRWPMPREVSVAWSSTLVCGARLSQQGSGTGLSYTLKLVHSTPLGLFNKCLGTPDAKEPMDRISPGAYGWYTAILLDNPCWQGWNFPRRLSVGGPTLQTRLL
ncbi:hypothetical protein HJG60_009719 [Phyllostomus discolor]|uniref:Uncharacterized protein n=1 Tax=Phyllostomus discolor TaxID=89673 RepID=A0A834EQ65_9CHIR|nr:hypothetical protein HJG60_009719 [Phyllostomus discolor]